MPRRTGPLWPRKDSRFFSQSEASATLSSTSSKPTLVGELVPGDRLVPGAQGVVPAQGQGIHLQPLRQPVHLALAGEDDLRLAEAAEGAAGDLVRAHHARVHLHVGHAIGAAGVHGAAEEDHGRERRVGAAVEEVVDLAGDQASTMEGSFTGLTSSAFKRIPGSLPYGTVMSSDGNWGYVSLWNASTVAELDLLSGKVSRLISLRKPNERLAGGSHPSTALLLNRDNSRLFVALTNRDEIAVIDTSSGKVFTWLSTKLPGQQYGGSDPESLSLSEDEKTLFSANSISDSVAVFDLTRFDRRWTF